MTQQEQKVDVPQVDGDGEKHLVFRLSNELYASPLISIKEIIKMQEIKTVPFMTNYFRGILNLRGMIVGVVDMRLKLDLPCQDPNQGLLVVVETPGGAIGAIVDDVLSVNSFAAQGIEKNIPLRTKIPMEFFVGVAQIDGRLVNVIDISATLSQDDFAVVRRIKSGESAASA